MSVAADRAQPARAMKQPVRSTLLVLLAVLSVAPGAAWAQAPTQAQSDDAEFARIGRLMDRSRAIESIADWDAVLEQIGKFASPPDARKAQIPDLSGRTWADYWTQHVMRPDAKSKLDELRALAGKQSAAGDEKSVAETLAQATPLLNAEKYRAMVVVSYGNNEGMLLYHRDTLKPWLDRATDADRSAADATLESAQNALLAAFETSLQSDSPNLTAAMALMSHASVENLEALNSMRLRLVETQSSLPNPTPVAPAIRSDVCPARVPPATDRSAPSLAKDFPAAESYYPRFLRSAWIAGPVVVRATIADSGCVLRAAVETTSGSADLDWAGLQLAMDGRYIAGSRDGQAVPGEVRFRIIFETHDTTP